MMIVMKQTQFIASSVFQDRFICGVEADTPHNVADLRSIYHAVSTVPEVEQIEHVSNVYNRGT